MAKITPRNPDGRPVVSVSTKKSTPNGPFKWWLANDKMQRHEMLLGTAAFLKEQGQYLQRQASVYARLYGNIPLQGIFGSYYNRIGDPRNLPADRPTMNVVQSCVDTLVSRLTQSRPRPVFLTDNGDYKARNLAKQLNQFISGELYSTKAYELAVRLLTDAAVLGTGCVKVFEDGHKKVALERVMCMELYVDPNDAMYGNPRQFYQLKLVDRGVLEAAFPKKASAVMSAEQAFPEAGESGSKSVADQVMVVEGWHLPSGPDAGDGRHTIATTSGCLLDEEYKKDDFPFCFISYNPRLLGFWGQGLAEQLMGTQLEINKLLVTISRSINLVGVPRVFLEDGSKVVKAQLNNEVGSIITYRGTKPIYEVAPCVPQEVYAQLQRLVDYAYQQSGISALAATSKKPVGLDSGAALREYDELQSDRFAALNKRYDQIFIDLAYKIIDLAKDIAERDGKYSSVYPNKDGTREIDLPKADLLSDTFIIQCHDSSSLPKDPAGRLQKITEMIQAGMLSIQEGRRLLDYPDLQQDEKLANASEERILRILDQIVDEGKYTPPDPFMDIQLAKKLSNQYYNLYVDAKLSEKRAEMLRTFNAQCVEFEQLAMQAAQPQPTPQALPEPLPQSPLVPNNQ